MGQIKLKTKMGDSRSGYLLEAAKKFEKVPVMVTIGPVCFRFEGVPEKVGQTVERGNKTEDWEVHYQEEYER